jgi:hypothetical protein
VGSNPAINFHFPNFGLRWTSLRVTKPPERNHFLKKGLLAASPEKFPYFYLIEMKNPPHSKPYFGLILAFKAH